MQRGPCVCMSVCLSVCLCVGLTDEHVIKQLNRSRCRSEIMC